MAPLAEIYLATMWKYQPVAVKRMMNQLISGTASFEGVQLMYDAEHYWVKVNCHPDHRHGIRRLFNQISAEIEEDVFDAHSSILNGDGTVKPSFDTNLILYDDVSYDSSRNLDTLEPYTFPASFAEAKYAHTATWNNLENEKQMNIHDLVDPDEFDKLKSDANVAMEYNSTGKLVYIGSHHYQGIQMAKAKLDVLLAFQKLPLARPQHLLYTEDHAEILRAEITADVRYMFNIDPNLPSSTLLDPACVTDLERAYQRMHGQGASIRLCIYDESRGRHFSIYGPKIKGRGGMRYPLGNRPNDFFKAIEPAPAPSPVRSTTQAEKDAFIKIAEPAAPLAHSKIQADKEAQVSKWIDEIPTDGTMAPPENDSQLAAPEYGLIRSSSNPGSSDRIVENIGRTSADPGVPDDKKEKPGTLVDEPVKKVDGPGSSLSQPSSRNQEGESHMSDSSAPVIHDEAVKQAIDEDRPIPVKKLGLPQMPKKTGPGDAKGDAIGGANPPLQTRGALETKPRQPPLTWSMAPLVPVPIHTTAGTGPSTSPGGEGKTDNDENENRFLQYHEPRTRGFSTMDQQTGRAGKVVTSASTFYKDIGTRAQDLAVQHPLTQDFTKEMMPALRRLLVGCRYKRGRITVRADLGRIILGGMDQTAMAFNNAKTHSNGWKKSHLLKNLNEQVVARDRLHFTKILSTYGSDLEHMINMTDGTGGQTNKRLWQSVPRESWIVYSFRCLYVEGTTEMSFLVNCRYGHEGKNNSYEILPFKSENDGVTPLYVHDVLRNWDLRITLTETDNPRLELVLGRAARKLFKSIRISKFEAEGIDMQFSLAEKKLFVHEVRVLTKWRYSNFNTTSELEITEVVPLVTTSVPDKKIRKYLSQLPSKRENRNRMSKGVYPRWYEASVVSTALEKVFKENENLPFAEKTSWSIESLEKFEGHNALRALYEPALQMLKQMDLVGGNECNNMPQNSEYEVRRRNDELDVPGFTQPHPPPVAVPPPGVQNRGGNTRQGSSASAARDPAAVGRARWEARMEEMKKQNKTFW